MTIAQVITLRSMSATPLPGREVRGERSLRTAAALRQGQRLPGRPGLPATALALAGQDDQEDEHRESAGDDDLTLAVRHGMAGAAGLDAAHGRGHGAACPGGRVAELAQ